MNNCVSYEIALKLKAAGFPEPHQLMSSDVVVWAYNPNISFRDALIAPLPLFDPHIFAPTISDLLPLFKGRVIADPYGMGFCADAGHIHSKVFISENIHDAVALVWLHENQPK